MTSNDVGLHVADRCLILDKDVSKFVNANLSLFTIVFSEFFDFYVLICCFFNFYIKFSSHLL